MESDLNRESYDAIAGRWDSHRTRLSEAEKRLIDLCLEATPGGGHVLDLGCGTGRPVAEYLSARQLRVTGVDQSSEMLSHARRRLPEQTWIAARLQDYQPPAGMVAVIVWDSLFHIPRVEHEGILARARSALAAGARMALTVGGSADCPAFTDTMFDRTFFYDSHSPEAARALLEKLGFEILHGELLNPPTGGRDRGRYAIVARAV
jgi:trans-aconitate methyltransferase